MRDLHSNLIGLPALNPQAIAANTTVNGAIIDLAGFDGAEFFIQSATITDGVFTPSIIEGNDPALADGAAVGAADILGTVAAATFVAADDNAVKRIGYRGAKRYIRLAETTTGVTTGGTIAAVCVRGYPRHLPVA